jgi:branched-chain amino acid transport system substrate-binding protein
MVLSFRSALPMSILLAITSLMPMAIPSAHARKSGSVEPVINLGVLITRNAAGDPDTQAAIRFALKDVNAFLASREDGPQASILLSVRGTGLDADAAAEKIQILAGRGLKVIIGPESSAEVEAIKPYTDANQMVLLSHCSTAPSLAVENDSVFRMVPSDLSQATAIAELIHSAGYQAIIPMWREGVWGDDISTASAQQFSNLGGTVYPGVRFDPEQTDFSAKLADLSEQVQDARVNFGAQVAVAYFSFGPEGALMLAQASAIPGLGDLTWFGSDGTALSREILDNPAAAQFAVKTGFFNTLFADPDTALANVMRARISAVIGGGGVHFCALAAYDAVWLAALAAALTGTDDIDAFKLALVEVANSYEGASGLTRLNDSGDRAGATYNVWGIEDVDGQRQWVVWDLQLKPQQLPPGQPLLE